MRHVVKLRKVELRPDAEVDKDVPVSVKPAECIHEEVKRRVGVDGILSKVQEVEESTGRTDEADVAHVVG